MHTSDTLPRRLLALLISTAIVLGMLPLPVYAEEQADLPQDVMAEVAEPNDGTEEGEPSVEDLSGGQGLPDEELTSDEEPSADPVEDPTDAEPELPEDEPDEADPPELDPMASPEAVAEPLDVTYQTHVQNVGWQDWVTSGGIAGTSGRSLRVEALRIKLPDGTEGGVTYRAHVQNVGWQGWVSDGDVAGTSGRSLRVEALEAKLTGSVAETHDIWYRAHVQNVGWQGWVKNGATAGTSGRSLRVEAIQVLVLPKGTELPADMGEVPSEDGETAASISYRASMGGLGWQGWMQDGATSGTVGQGLSINGFGAALAGLDNADLHMSAHVQNVGWDGEVAGGGTVGRPSTSNTIEALRLWLTGEAASAYDLYCHTYVSGIGWTAWAKNGEATGSTGMNLPIQAIQVRLVPKGGEAPSSDGCRGYALLEKPKLELRAHVQNVGWQGWVGEGATAGTSGRSLRVEALEARVTSNLTGEVQIRAHVQNVGWQDWVGEGSFAGTSGRALRVEAFQVRLTGELAEQYDVYYRVHAQKIGWMGWAKNGASAGTEALSLRLEAVQVKLVRKGGSAPGSTAGAYINGKNVTKLGYQNPSGFYQVSSKNVTITSAARAPFNYITPSRIGVWASRQDCVNAFLARAREYVGTPYVWNYSCAPGVGVDCIGLVYQCAYACGMDLGGGTGNNDFNPWAHYSTGNSGWHSHDANNFWYYGKAMHVSVGARQPGDVLWWPGHVAIYLGGDTLIEAYTPSTGVIYSSLSSRSYPSGCIRLFQ